MQYTNLTWRNGQPYSEMFDDIYYSSDENERISGESEFNHVFFKSNGLPERWNCTGDFVVAELGFGSGLNCLLTIREWLMHLDECKQDKCLHYIALEKYPFSPDTIEKLISRYPDLKDYCDELVAVYPPAVKGSHSRHLFDNRVVIHYKFMDVFDALKDERYHVDAWYLDGFSPAKNPDMWSEKLFAKIAQNSHSKTTCSTYTAAGFVKRNLQNNGFEVRKVNGHGNKREMLVAKSSAEQLTAHKFVDKPWFNPPDHREVVEKEATVIGAGIAGLSVAYSLVKRGWSVTIIDRQRNVAMETSSNPAAIVYPRLSVNNDVDTEFYTAAYCYALYVLKSLQEKHADTFWLNNGLLQLFDETRLTEIIDKYSFNKEFVTKTNVALKEDESSSSEVSTVFANYQQAGVLLPDMLCDAIVQACGEKLKFVHSDIDSLQSLNGRWHCLSGSVLVTEAKVLVMAGGNNINSYGLDINFPVESVRGQVAELYTNKESKKIKKVINSDVYLTPALRDRHYLGATYSRNNFNLVVDPEENKRLLESFDRVYGKVFNSDSVSNTWVGFRAMSKDRVPIVGAVPDQKFFLEEYADIKHGRKNKSYNPAEYLDGLYISAAHGSRGFTSSFLSAEIIAAQITGEPAPVSKRILGYLQPSRFIVNDLKRR
jgi:tRNA 5-methylaminomethyl-2-thiouridine biosynthesis bifunctional protein